MHRSPSTPPGGPGRAGIDCGRSGTQGHVQRSRSRPNGTPLSLSTEVTSYSRSSSNARFTVDGDASATPSHSDRTEHRSDEAMRLDAAVGDFER